MFGGFMRGSSLLWHLTEKAAEKFLTKGVSAKRTRSHTLLLNLFFYLDKDNCRANLFGNTAKSPTGFP
jgi:hypothetical protein